MCSYALLNGIITMSPSQNLNGHIRVCSLIQSLKHFSKASILHSCLDSLTPGQSSHRFRIFQSIPFQIKNYDLPYSLKLKKLSYLAVQQRRSFKKQTQQTETTSCFPDHGSVHVLQTEIASITSINALIIVGILHRLLLRQRTRLPRMTLLMAQSTLPRRSRLPRLLRRPRRHGRLLLIRLSFLPRVESVLGTLRRHMSLIPALEAHHLAVAASPLRSHLIYPLEELALLLSRLRAHVELSPAVGTRLVGGAQRAGLAAVARGRRRLVRVRSEEG